MFKAMEIVSSRRFWLMPLPCLFFLIPLFTKKDIHFPLFPDLLPIEALSQYTDSGDGGRSRFIVSDSSDDVRFMEYELFDTKNYFIPYVGYSLSTKELVKPFALTRYDTVALTIRVDHRQTCYMLLNMYVEEGSPLVGKVKDVSLMCELPLYKDQDAYKLAIDDFFVPDWWLFENGLTEDRIDRKYLKRIRTINFHFGAQDNNYANKVYLQDITFTRDQGNFYLWWGGATLVYILLILMIHSIVQQHMALLKRREKIVVPYDTLDKITLGVQSLKEIVTYIGSHYMQEGLSVSDAANACGVSSGRVSQLLGEHFQEVSFKQYLNMIRVYEAKRLILESEMNISEIGFTVGFANVTHFNRTFKSILEITPSELRRQKRAGHDA